MTAAQALDHLKTRSSPGSVPGLEAVECLLDELGNPHLSLKYVHVAGTNGKGSTCAFISSILITAGYKTGLFISPEISEFNEQIQINGQKIPDDEIVSLVSEIMQASRRVVKRGVRLPSYFEYVTAMAFLYFKKHNCDIIVLETGLGGRLDATNVIKECLAAVITNIGLDHTEYLGTTVEHIASEKAGIIKKGCTAVMYAQSREAENAVAEACEARGAELLIADAGRAEIKSIAPDRTVFSYDRFEELKINLTGIYQVKNAVTAIETALALRRRGYDIPDETIKQGLAAAIWPGRFEFLGRAPYIIVDGAHNPQGAEALMQSLSQVFPGKKIIFIFGILADKDYRSVILLSLPFAKRYYTISPPNERALNPVELAENIGIYADIPVTAFSDISEALDTAIKEASPEDVICIFGSLYQVGEIHNYFGRNK